MSWSSRAQTRRESNDSLVDGVNFNEKQWAIYGIIISYSVIVGKLLYQYGETIKAKLLDTKLIQVDQLAEDGQLMFKHVFKTTVKYSNLWLPFVCGSLVTYITWLTVYLDSHEPGVHPPSPLSPQRYKNASGHAFHLSYIFAILMGGMVTYYLYVNGMNIEFTT